ncbi:hypothetical protein COU60_04820 [Candidatus Pacearchaeota archaeon CG10_big_fil_rev_8_21_14_0_10_34_76]|nr:MAG: hypothetical protein COU60_04820 [Candidatus Pacearchaeota archaeon CG10_big_fil_rev_8_21_14_0_10_34_76]
MNERTKGNLATIAFLTLYGSSMIGISNFGGLGTKKEVETTYHGENIKVVERNDGRVEAVYMDRRVVQPFGNQHLTLVDKDGDGNLDYVNKGAFAVGRPAMGGMIIGEPTDEQRNDFAYLRNLLE